MRSPLWQPTEDRKKQANMARFSDFVNRKEKTVITGYDELYDWSVTDIPAFWAAMWEFAVIKASHSYQRVVDDPGKFPGAKWFEGARLNFAENLLRYRDDRTALIFKGETRPAERMTYAELYREVACLARSLRELGLRPGDRVAAYLPNLKETAIAMLAATSIGAVWSSCATDLGAQATLDRLGQIEPKVLFVADGYYYKGSAFDSLARAAEVARGMPSLEKVVVVRYLGGEPDIRALPHAVFYDRFLRREESPELRFEALPFDHPVYIMFSSGTTGRPKCLVQGAGGVLINHLKELVLHTDLKREDTILYVTTCSWMMWNWLLSSLAVGAAVVLYDGNPGYPGPGALWELAQEEKITVFGTSASYINYLKSRDFRPGDRYDLSRLRTISQTGSALSAGGFEYVYRAIKEDLHFASISGGTDINGCFAQGCPTLPVYAGEIQRPALGMKVKCYDDGGQPVIDRLGELVCEAPSPSMPLYFWNDPDGEKYREAYFNHFPGVWRHGDYIMIHGDTGGITFFGRSDAVLKPSGVRIGTAEIYNQVEKFPEISDCLAIGQEWRNDQRIVLFLRMAEGYELTDELKGRLRKTLRDEASPRHVPARILPVPDIPYTLNMKKVETAVTNIIHGRSVSNRDALVNPESLDAYENLIPELQRE